MATRELQIQRGTPVRKTIRRCPSDSALFTPLCSTGAGFVPGNMTLSAKSIDTGLIRLEILEPELITQQSLAVRRGGGRREALAAAAALALWSALA